MKNIHIISTSKPSMLAYYQESTSYNKPILVNTTSPDYKYQNIYITSDEEIKLGNYVIQINFEKTNTQVIQCVTEFQVKIANDKDGSFTKKKIVLTTDRDLIKYGIRAIDNEFIEWLIKNPNCEYIEVTDYAKVVGKETDANGYREMNVFKTILKIIIPQTVENFKQKGLEIEPRYYVDYPIAKYLKEKGFNFLS